MKKEMVFATVKLIRSYEYYAEEFKKSPEFYESCFSALTIKSYESLATSLTGFSNSRLCVLCVACSTMCEVCVHSTSENLFGLFPCLQHDTFKGISEADSLASLSSAFSRRAEYLTSLLREKVKLNVLSALLLAEKYREVAKKISAGEEIPEVGDLKRFNGIDVGGRKFGHRLATLLFGFGFAHTCSLCREAENIAKGVDAMYTWISTEKCRFCVNFEDFECVQGYPCTYQDTYKRIQLSETLEEVGKAFLARAEHLESRVEILLAWQEKKENENV